MSMLGLDIGTTGVKAVAFHEDGSFIASRYREYDLKSPRPGYLEIDPTEVLAAIREVTNAIASDTKSDPIRSLAACTLGEAAVPVDEACRPVGNAIVGFDSRGDEDARDFRARISNEEVFAIAGHGINSYHTLFKILWRRREEPKAFARARRYLCFGDFAAAAMGIPPRMEYSVAARTLCFDIHALDWSDRILGAAGLSREILPPAVSPGERLGELGDSAAREFGLPRGCVVAAGLHDQPAGILGAGIRPGESMLAVGTTICLGVRLRGEPSARAMIDGNLCYYPTAGEKEYISIAFNFTGGSLLKWYRDNLAGPELDEARRNGVDPYEAITQGLPADPTGLLVLPHFTTSGTPWLDPRGLGVIAGLRLTTTRKEFVKAILEGIIYEIHQNAELLRSAGADIQLFKAIGGAAKSPAWMQIAADILARPVAITRVTEGAALGAALLGARAAGVFHDMSEVHAVAERSARVDRSIEPRPEHVRRYAERFELYRELYPAMKKVSHGLFGLTVSSN